LLCTLFRRIYFAGCLTIKKNVVHDDSTSEIISS
jgi:hypothetical protein